MQARSGTNLISEWRWWRKGIRWVTLTCSLEINQLACAPWKFGHDQYWGRVIADTDLSLEHGGRRGAPLVLQPEGHRRGHAVLEITDLDQEDKLPREKYFGPRLTERKAWMRSALILAKGFPFTTTVYVSSFSVDIRLPNQDLFVSSGEDSGVWCTLTTSRKWRNSIKILFVSFHAKVTASIPESWIGPNRVRLRAVEGSLAPLHLPFPINLFLINNYLAFSFDGTLDFRGNYSWLSWVVISSGQRRGSRGAWAAAAQCRHLGAKYPIFRFGVNFIFLNWNKLNMIKTLHLFSLNFGSLESVMIPRWYSPWCCLSCLWTLGEAKGESGGTGEGDSDTGSPRELSEEPLGCRRRLLKHKESCYSEKFNILC